MKILEVQHVVKTYGSHQNQVKALSDVSFAAEQGEFIAIVGTSGSGKSTLLNLLGGLDVPTEGRICIRGYDIGSLTRKEQTIFRRRNIGFVFQNYSLMPVLNVYDNVALPITFDKGSHVDREYIRGLLNELGLWEKRKRYPSELSGGQQQRAAIARALANKPALLLADEPTGNLDSKTAVEVIGLLKASSQKYHQTVLMVTHNEALAQSCDRIIRIEDGRLYQREDAFLPETFLLSLRPDFLPSRFLRTSGYSQAVFSADETYWRSDFLPALFPLLPEIQTSPASPGFCGFSRKEPTLRLPSNPKQGSDLPPE